MTESITERITERITEKLTKRITENYPDQHHAQLLLLIYDTAAAVKRRLSNTEWNGHCFGIFRFDFQFWYFQLPLQVFICIWNIFSHTSNLYVQRQKLPPRNRSFWFWHSSLSPGMSMSMSMERQMSMSVGFWKRSTIGRVILIVTHHNWTHHPPYYQGL